MGGKLTGHEGDLEPDEEYDGVLFADAPLLARHLGITVAD